MERTQTSLKAMYSMYVYLGCLRAARPGIVDVIRSQSPCMVMLF